MQHQNFKLENSGLKIHTSYPHLGASPDGIITCDCCEKEVLEIKCPYSARELPPEDAIVSIDCLELSDGGGGRIKKNTFVPSASCRATCTSSANELKLSEHECLWHRPTKCVLQGISQGLCKL